MIKPLSYCVVLLCLLVSAPAAGQSWRYVAPLPEARHGMSAVVLGDHVYVLGGMTSPGATDPVPRATNRVLRYDAGRDVWDEDVPDMARARTELAAAVLNGHIFVMGGRDPDAPDSAGRIQDEVEVFDPLKGTWRAAGRLNRARYGHAAVVLGGRLYVVGGEDAQGRLIADVEYYDPDEDRWTVSDAWRPLPRVAFALVSIGEVAFTFGGFGGLGRPGPLDTVEQFAPGLGLRVLVPPVRLGRRGRLAAAVVGHSAFVLGGRSGIQDQVLADVWTFTPEPGPSWQEASARMQDARESFAAASVEGQVYAVGGLDRDGKMLNTVEVLVVGTSVPREVELPSELHLEQNHPNPFIGSTTIPFLVTSARSERVTLEIYDVRGRLLQTLVDAPLPPGRHEVLWDGHDSGGRPAGSGVYLYVLRQGDVRVTGFLTRIR